MAAGLQCPLMVAGFCFSWLSRPFDSLIFSMFNSLHMFKALGVGAMLLWGIMPAFGQYWIRGEVTGQQGQPLEGAHIWLVETRQGTATDPKGRFELEVGSSATLTLEVSYLGYSTYRTAISAQTAPAGLHIALREFSYQVDELVVRGTRSERRTPMTFLNVRREDIRRLDHGQDLPVLLQWTPSAVVTSDAGTGVGYTGIRIRGADATRINVTINGIPVNDAESQAVYWVNMPDVSASVADIQIQRGVGSSTNGAGAFGATINLNTSRVNHEPYAGLSTAGGSFNTWKRNVEFGTGLLSDKFTVDGRLSRITSDGYIDRASADLNAYYLSAAYVGSRSLIRFNIFSGHEVTYQAWYGVPASLIGDWDTRTFNPAGTEKTGDPYPREEDNYRQTHYQALFNQQLSKKWNLNLALHYTKGAGYYEQYKAAQTFSDYGLQPLLENGQTLQTDLVRRLWLDNDFYGGVYSLHYAGQGLDLTLGGAIHQYDGAHFGELVWAEYASNSQPGDRYYENEAQKLDANVYAKAVIPIAEGWSAYGDLQYRTVDYRFLGYNRNGDNVEQEARLHFLNPKAGLHYAPDARRSFYASFAVAQREPNRDDYVQSTPESRPRPEKLLNTEVGYRTQIRNIHLDLNVFHMYYIDQLALNGQINDVGAYIRANVERSYRAGVEAAVLWQVGEKLQWKGNLALSRNKIQQFEEFLDEYATDPATQTTLWVGQKPVVHQQSDLAFSPAVVAGAEWTIQPFKGKPWLEGQELECSWMTRFVGRQFIDNTSDPGNAIDPYSFTNVQLRYSRHVKHLGKWEVSVMVQNLFNHMYETNAWSYRYIYDGQQALDQGFFPQAGRNVLFGLQVRW